MTYDCKTCDTQSYGRGLQRILYASNKEHGHMMRLVSWIVFVLLIKDSVKLICLTLSVFAMF
jgi:hypothetical protein